jgi:hypothetical protein
MVEDASILARMTEGDEAPPNPVLMLLRLPLGMYVGANRYDTDNECVLSLWTAEGVTHDIRWPGPSTGTSAGEGE